MVSSCLCEERALTFVLHKGKMLRYCHRKNARLTAAASAMDLPAQPHAGRVRRNSHGVGRVFGLREAAPAAQVRLHVEAVDVGVRAAAAGHQLPQRDPERPLKHMRTRVGHRDSCIWQEQHKCIFDCACTFLFAKVKLCPRPKNSSMELTVI